MLLSCLLYKHDSRLIELEGEDADGSLMITNKVIVSIIDTWLLKRNQV